MISKEDFSRRLKDAGFARMRSIHNTADLLNNLHSISLEPASSSWNKKKLTQDDMLLHFNIRLLGLPIEIWALYKLVDGRYSECPALVKMDFID